MFGQYAFAGGYFGESGILKGSITASKKGWPFGADLAIPYADQIAAIESGIALDDQEVIDVALSWLSNK